METLRSFHEMHERLKKRIHTAWRYPLPRWGQLVMGCFYASIPVVGGYYVTQWAIGKSVESIGEKGEKLQVKDVKGLGDTAMVNGEQRKVGAGGFLGGVKLARSSAEEQKRSKEMLKDFLKKEEKKMKKIRKRKEEQDVSYSQQP